MAFLRARWRDLLMVNWPIPREKLLPFVPAGCQLDSFEGKTYISLVAFLFEQTRVLGVSLPGYRHFEEVNLRFYVTHKTDSDEIRRGVVFLREYVPKKLIALVAKKVYQEPYEVLPMSHESCLTVRTPTSCFPWLSAEQCPQRRASPVDWGDAELLPPWLAETF